MTPQLVFLEKMIHFLVMIKEQAADLIKKSRKAFFISEYS